MVTITNKVVAIVPAAGVGKRMQIDYPKQYLTIGNKTILEHSVEILLHHPQIIKVIIPTSQEDQWFNTLPLATHPQVIRVNGNSQRASSVLSALSILHSLNIRDAWILVHDAVRPCLHDADLKRLLALIGKSQVGGILAKPVRDTIKSSQKSKQIAFTLNRDDLWCAMTPQLFPFKILYNCLNHALDKGANITDEASALEYCGFHPELIESRADNIKVTYPEDLDLVTFYLKIAKIKEII